MLGRFGRDFGRLGGAGGARYSAEAKQFFDRLTTQPTALRASQYNALIGALVAAGVWAKLDALYVLAAADEDTARINLISSSFACINGVAGLSFVADQGGTGNGSNAQWDTQYNLSSSGTNYTQNDAGLFVWQTKTGTDAGGTFGTNAGTGSYIYPRYTDGNYYIRANQGSDVTTAIGTGAGLYLVVRTGAAAGRFDINGSEVTTFTTSSTALVNSTMRIGKSGGDFYSGKIVCAGLGGSLNATQSTALYNALNTYFTAIGTTL